MRKYNISREVFKFPYNGNFETNDNEMFSEKFCYCIIRVRKKIVYGIKYSLICGEFILNVAGGLNPAQAIGLPIVPINTNTRIVRSSNSKKIKTTPAIHKRNDKIIYQEIEFEEFDNIISRFLEEDVDAYELNLILQLKGGDQFIDLIALIGFIIFVNWLDSLHGVEPFSVSPPPHMDPFYWL